MVRENTLQTARKGMREKIMRNINDNSEVIITYCDGVESFEATGMTDKEVAARIKKCNETHNCFPLMEII